MQRARLAEVMHGHNVGMVQTRQGAGLAVEPFGKAGIAGDRRWQYLQGNETVQGWLARLVNRAHAALADEAEDFELGKELGDFLDGWRHKALAGGLTGNTGFGSGGKAGFDEAFRAQPERHVRRQRLATIRANFLRFHMSGILPSIT